MREIAKLLKSRGIDPKTLTEEEKATIASWREAGKEVTVQSILEFCKTQCIFLESQFRDADISDKKLNRLAQQHVVYSSIAAYIEGGDRQRKYLQNYLTELSKKDTI